MKPDADGEAQDEGAEAAEPPQESHVGMTNEPVVVLDYAAPPERTRTQPRFTFRLIFRLYIKGPLVGAVSGAISAATAILAWAWFGKPEFFFKPDSKGVQEHLWMMAILGAVAGFPFELAVSQFELLARRHVPFWRLLMSTIVLSLLIFAPVNYLQIRDRSLWAGIMPELTVAVLGFFIAVGVSRPDA